MVICAHVHFSNFLENEQQNTDEQNRSFLVLAQNDFFLELDLFLVTQKIRDLGEKNIFFCCDGLIGHHISKPRRAFSS